MEHALTQATHDQPSDRLVTVGIPVFNGKALLRNCLQSVINSTLPRDRFEVVIADDGSSEPETHAILGQFEKDCAADVGFFRVISLGSNSGGAARPRNRILDVATGEYVFFVDADDMIGDLALERIAEAVTRTPADWVALNQVPVNGRGALCRVRQAHLEVPRTKALSTLTVHKVFRRAEIERQQLRFDELLPSGQDVSFAFAYILNAARFLMIGGYDYYYLTRHADNPDEPAHLSRRDKTPTALIDKNERILSSMLMALSRSQLPVAERRTIVGQVCLPRVLLQQGYLKAIVNAGPRSGMEALRRLSAMLADPLLASIDDAELKGVTREYLSVIARTDWPGLAQLIGPPGASPASRTTLVARWVTNGRRFLDIASGRARHRRLVQELVMLRRSVEDLREVQRRIESNLQGHSQPRRVRPAEQADATRRPA